MPQTKLGNENDNANEVNNEWCENENENEWVKLKLKLTKCREKKLNWAQNVETKSGKEESESETSDALQFFRVKLFYKCGSRVRPHL